MPYAPLTAKPATALPHAAAVPLRESRRAGDAGWSPDRPLDRPTAFSLGRIPATTPPVLQPQLAIGAPDDACERQADRVASQVAEPRSGRSPLSAPMRLQRAPSSSGRPSSQQHVGDAPPSVATALRGHGRPLERDVRRDMEQSFGADFSGVRVHDGAAAAASARDVTAHAYTVGRDIVFAEGRYAPRSAGGRRLLAHELAHVTQQTGRLQRAPAESHTDFVIAPQAMEHLEGLLLELYEALPRAERIALKANGTVAVVLATNPKGSLNEPIYGYTTASNSGSDPFRPSSAFLKAAEKVGLVPWLGDSGAVADRSGPSRYYSPAGGPPPGTGGIDHAEQLAKGYAEDHGLVIHGMVVSRRFCHDCPLVIRGIKGGRVMVSVIPDPDDTLPNPRAERAKAKQAGAKTTGQAEDRPLSDAAAEDGTGAGRGRGGGGDRVGSRGGGRDSGRVGGRGGGRIAPTGFEVTRPLASNTATRNAIEGAWGMILAHQLGSVRAAEVEKAVARLDELGPEIERYREQGIDVTVTVVAEVPDRPDVAAHVTGVGDAGQVVYFKRLYISGLSLPPSAATSTVSTMYPAGGQDPGRVHRSEMTLDQQIRDQMGEKYPVPGTGPRAGFHFREASQTFPGYRAVTSAAPAPMTPDRFRGIGGTYTPEFRKLFVGDMSQIAPLFARSLTVTMDGQGLPLPKMTLGSREYAFDNGGPRPPSMAMTGRFKMGEGRPPDAQWYWSAMEYFPDKGIILEWAHGQDSALNTIWDTLFLWRRR